MRFTLLMNYGEPSAGVQVDAQVMEDTMRAMDAFAKAMDTAGVLVAATVLYPSAATSTVTRRTGVVQIEDGPFADTKEALGGLFILEVPDKDAAIGWAEKCPMAEFGVVEVRQSATHFERGEWQH